MSNTWEENREPPHAHIRLLITNRGVCGWQNANERTSHGGWVENSREDDLLRVARRELPRHQHLIPPLANFSDVSPQNFAAVAKSSTLDLHPCLARLSFFVPPVINPCITILLLHRSYGNWAGRQPVPDHCRPALTAGHGFVRSPYHPLCLRNASRAGSCPSCRGCLCLPMGQFSTARLLSCPTQSQLTISLYRQVPGVEPWCWGSSELMVVSSGTTRESCATPGTRAPDPSEYVVR
ncbi:hypothetical protein SODALDRAFT_363371 [Sodiomyces alkalinus F11]|uniref:Uncharacterized protein n=1 Tax=Sodiomyces alkalinus (strain CBS 110278 / VKM F-3762 / F11) TaxID=1314773 RepID=A0A3N2PLX4_SODAK|nr:hypothetical protein SODALDRAFT_363371 [Sodiomyces alkalinus F11]ROT35531.1 hypothetical protein SODALDRAFT_363371 [Sodiomyces alkalinus F11]